MRVIITDLRENTFYALIELSDAQGNLISIDARPSDAIALALRFDCSIFVKQNVLDNSITSNQNNTAAESDVNNVSEDWPDLIG